MTDDLCSSIRIVGPVCQLQVCFEFKFVRFIQNRFMVRKCVDTNGCTTALPGLDRNTLHEAESAVIDRVEASPNVRRLALADLDGTLRNTALMLQSGDALTVPVDSPPSNSRVGSAANNVERRSGTNSGDFFVNRNRYRILGNAGEPDDF